MTDGSFTEGPERAGGFDDILVVGVSPDFNQRCAFEYSLVDELRSGTVKATTSCSVMTAKEPLTRESIEKAVATLGVDAVVATSLVASEVTVKEGGSADARGGGYYKATGVGYEPDYWGVYGVPVVYGKFEVAPSVFSLSGTARLTTRLFDTRDAALIYSIDTHAKRLSSRETAVAEISQAIGQRLRQDGLLR